VSTTELTFPLIRAQVEAIRKKIPEATVFGIHSPSRWIGEPIQQDGEETFLVRQCDSPLEMRLALRETASTTPFSTRVLVTRLQDQDISEELRLRLTKRRLFSFDRWNVVKTLFQAKSIDPRLSAHSWMADALLEVSRESEFPPAAGGFLDAETAWGVLLERRLGFTNRRPDLQALLEWTTKHDRNPGERFATTDEQFQFAAAGWLEQFCGPAARVILPCLVNNASDVVPLGLVLGTLLHPQASTDALTAIGVVQVSYLNGQTVEKAWAEPWAKTAADVTRSLANEDHALPPVAKRADEILKEINTPGLAYLGDFSPMGLLQRYEQFAHELTRIINARDFSTIVPLMKCRESIRTHEDPRKDPGQLERVDMAIRLVQWLGKSGADDTPPADLPRAARDHLDDGSFADWARLRFRTADPIGALDQAYKSLGRLAAEVRERDAETFATLLKGWTSSNASSDDVVPLEEILTRIVAPLAQAKPTLVILLDGMSGAVFHELVNDITGNEWLSVQPADQDKLPAGLATLPSVTEASRTSFFCGTLQTGNSNTEKKAFAKHSVLKPLTDGGKPPELFHKAQLTSDESGLAVEVRKTIGSSNHRIVAVVVNAVDSHLTSNEQIETQWTKNSIKPLGGLLHEAHLADRAVVLVSDHGHILEQDSQLISTDGECGERWRPPSGELRDDELEISGNRVLKPSGNALVAPWTESVRYSIKKNGYHGGFNPQEMVIPIGVLCPIDSCPDDWTEAKVAAPEWWDLPLETTVTEPLPPPKVRRAEPKPPPDRLFDPVPAGEEADQLVEWVTAMMESELFESQKSLAGRQVPDDDTIKKIISTLDQNGGKMTIQSLARATEFPPGRLRGLVAVLQRILNIDSYQVLWRDDATQTFELNRELLLQQFGLTDS
jgi:hypothetical protein